MHVLKKRDLGGNSHTQSVSGRPENLSACQAGYTLKTLNVVLKLTEKEFKFKKTKFKEK